MAIHKVCLLFGGTHQLVAGLELQHSKETLQKHTYLLDDCYPLHRETNDYLLTQVQKRWEDKITIYKNEENEGIHKGYGKLLSLMPLDEDDYILFVAPDSVPLMQGFDYMMADVLANDQNIMFVGNNSYAIDQTPCQWLHKVTPTGTRYKIPVDRPAMFHMTMFRWSFLKHVGGFNQPTKYYGHIESDMWQKLQNTGFQMAYLEDSYEDFRLEAYHDDVYRRWKIAHAHTFTFPSSFKEYVEAGYK